MNVLPPPIANGRNHIGTIAGKLNGRDRRADADRLADRLAVDVGRDALEVAPLHRLRHRRTRASTISIARSTSARASPSVLPISSVTDAASSLGALGRAPGAGANRSCARRITRRRAPSRAAPPAPPRPPPSTSSRPLSGTRASTSPVAGWSRPARSLGARRHPAAADEVLEDASFDCGSAGCCCRHPGLRSVTVTPSLRSGAYSYYASCIIKLDMRNHAEAERAHGNLGLVACRPSYGWGPPPWTPETR